MKKIAVLASGSAKGGGSGFEKLAEAIKRGDLEAEIVCVLSNHVTGGVAKKARKYGIRFVHFASPWTAKKCYQLIGTDIDLLCMSGWLKRITRLDPQRTINIHPGPLPEFGGPGMYGHHVHEAVMQAYRDGKIHESAVSMHFVTDEYDAGPVFFALPIPIEAEDTVDSLAKRVNAAEHLYQWQFTKHVLEGRIRWDGSDPESLICA